MVRSEIQNIEAQVRHYRKFGRAESCYRYLFRWPTDLSVLITGESGVGKENFPQIIHQFSRRKHGQYIAVNCGAILNKYRFRTFRS